MEIGNLEAFLGIFTLSSYIQHCMMVNSFMQFLVYRTVSLAFLYVFCTAFIALPSELFASPSTEDSDACRCVVFRFDDIQDYSKRDNGQIAPLEVFREKNASVTLGIIAGFFGKDLEIVNYTKIGVGEGLFEPSIHGWSHVSYPDLSLEEQTSSISNASSVLDRIYHTKPNVFIPPYNEFNQDTVQALVTNEIQIMSGDRVHADALPENVINTYVAKNSASHVSDVDEAGSNVIYHLPQTIGFYKNLGDQEFKVEIEDIISEVNKAVSRYGYGVITLHPTDFIDSSESRNLVENEIEDLARLIDMIRAQGLKIVSFQDVLSYSK